MSSIDILRAWAAAAEAVDVPWYLCRETLLCVNGYRAIPETVPTVQIAIPATHLSAVAGEMIGHLPQDWRLHKQAIASCATALAFVDTEGQTVLAIDVLYGVKSAEQMTALAAELKSLRADTRKKIKAAGDRAGDVVDAAFERLMARMQTVNEDIRYYTTVLTDPTGVLIRPSCFPVKIPRSRPSGPIAPIWPKNTAILKTG